MVKSPKTVFVRYRTISQNNFMLFFHSLRSVSLMMLVSLASAIALIQAVPVKAQTPATPSDVNAEPNAEPSSEPDLRPLAQDGTLLSVSGGRRLMEEASNAVSAQNYDLAVQRLQDARQLFNQLSNFHQELAGSFAGIDTRIADDQREQAVAAAQMRDQATYQLALVHRARNQPELAVPLLIQIVRSQNPTRELGQQAYQQLYELGFVSSPFPRSGGQSTSAAPQSNQENQQ
jgi:hypothetical protein